MGEKTSRAWPTGARHKPSQAALEGNFQGGERCEQEAENYW